MENLNKTVVRREVYAGVFKFGSRVTVNSEDDEDNHGRVGKVISIKTRFTNVNVVLLDGDALPKLFLDEELDEPRRQCKKG